VREMMKLIWRRRSLEMETMNSWRELLKLMSLTSIAGHISPTKMKKRASTMKANLGLLMMISNKRPQN
jgi:hypothetical protein